MRRDGTCTVACARITYGARLDCSLRPLPRCEVWMTLTLTGIAASARARELPLMRLRALRLHRLRRLSQPGPVAGDLRSIPAIRVELIDAANMQFRRCGPP